MGNAVCTARSKARSDVYLGYYFLLGPNRTQDKLLDILHALGVKIAPGTIEGYSSRDHWVERVAEMDKELGLHDPASRMLIETRETMNLKQAELGRAMQDLARKRLGQMTEGDLLEVGANDVVRLAEVGQKIERLAVGEVTERREVVTSVVNSVIQPLCDLFVQINLIESSQERLHRFAEGADRIVDSYVVQSSEVA